MTKFININYKQDFKDSSLEFFLSYKNKLISQDSISNVTKISLNNKSFFLKRYYKPGKRFYSKLSKFLPFVFSKAKREFRNLLFFANNGFNTPKIAYFAESKGCSSLVTEELNNSQNLYEYFSQNKVDKTNINYLFEFAKTLANLHNKNFIHRDYKLRNVILCDDNKLYLIDCPNGFECQSAVLLNKYIIRDLAIGYKDIRKVLPPKVQLALFKCYLQLAPKTKLDSNNKAKLQAVMGYYSNS